MNRYGTALVTVLMTTALIPWNSFARAQIHKGPPRVPASGVREFERSAFCHRYECLLDSIEPLRIHGFIEEWFYNYRVYPRQGDYGYAMQIGMRLGEDGERTSPYLLIRWFPMRSLPVKEFKIAGDLIREVTGSKNLDAATLLTEFGQSLNLKQGNVEETGPQVDVGSRKLKLSFSRGTKNRCRYPQMTVLIE
jgi:hypothetical protein